MAMAAKDPEVVAITPAMTAGSCLDDFLAKHPDRCFDVGIAEGHAVTFAGAMAKEKGLKVFCSIYATFLQRALDNLFHDVALQRSPVVFAIDRAGISGPDGSTHHGVYDISFLQAMPEMVICQPRNGHVLKELLESCFSWNKTTAIRYPNMATEEESTAPLQERLLGKGEILSKGKDLLIISLGHMNKTALELKNRLLEDGINPTIVDPVFVKPLDEPLFLELISSHKHVVTIEEHSLQGGLGSAVSAFMRSHALTPENVLHFGIDDQFLDHGSYLEVLFDAGLTTEQIYTSLKSSLKFSSDLAGMA